MDEKIKIIEVLHKKNAHCIDVFPCTMPDAKFFQVEKIMLKRKGKRYAEKICNIIVLLWGLYDMEIYLTEFPPDSQCNEYAKLAYTNIADIGLEKLCNIIEFVILNDISSVEILFPACEFEISIGGGFNTAVYNIAGENLAFLKLLAEHEQLYIRKCV